MSRIKRETKHSFKASTLVHELTKDILKEEGLSKHFGRYWVEVEYYVEASFKDPHESFRRQDELLKTAESKIQSVCEELTQAHKMRRESFRTTHLVSDVLVAIGFNMGDGSVASGHVKVLIWLEWQSNGYAGSPQEFEDRVTELASSHYNSAGLCSSSWEACRALARKTLRREAVIMKGSRAFET